MRALFNVNVLIALLDPDHPASHAAHQWLSGHTDGTATCPIVQNGALRVMTQASYAQGGVPLTLRQVLGALRKTLDAANHEFWPDAVSLADTQVFDHDCIFGPKQLTDIYLLGLAVSRKACLVTLDQNIPLSAVRGAQAANLVVL
jgi:uncharacterized protein